MRRSLRRAAVNAKRAKKSLSAARSPARARGAARPRRHGSPARSTSTPNACARGVLKRSGCAERVGDGGARLARDQRRRRRCPIRGPSAASRRRSASPAATIAMRSAIELGLATATRSRVDLGQRRRSARARRRSSPRSLTRIGTPLRVAPLPGLGAPHLAARRRVEHADHRLLALDQRDRHRPAGAAADDNRACRRSDRPPTRGARSSRSRLSAVSSDSQPASGSSAREPRRAATRRPSRSTSQTGLPGAFSQRAKSVRQRAMRQRRPPRRRSRATASAS